jgi:hypothetical protein
MPRGRPTKLTAQIQAEIVKRIAVGNHADVAAVAAGVSRSTFYSWQKLGRKRKTGRHREFVLAITRAESEAEVQAIAIVRQAMKGGQVVERHTRTKRDGSVEITEKLARAEWTAARWFAERRHAERWGRKETEEIAKLARQIAQLRRVIYSGRA